MKQISILLVVLAMAFLFSSYLTQEQEKGNKLSEIEMVLDEGFFRSPQFSPDDSKLIFSTMKSNGIFLLDLTNKKTSVLTNIPTSGFRATWTLSGNKVVFRHKVREPNSIPYFLVKTVDLYGNMHETPAHVKPYNFFSGAIATDASDPIVTVNDQTFQIEVSSINDSRPTVITTEPGNYFMPLLSPDKTKILVHRGSEMLVFATDGSGLIKSLGNGIAGSWSPDCKYVISYLDSSVDGHQVSGSELYLSSLATGQQEQLTFTPDIFEMYPDWSHDGTKISFSDYNTGHLYVAKINL